MWVDHTVNMVRTCTSCGQKFRTSEYNHHKSTHQTHLEEWGAKLTWKAPEGLKPALFQVFENYKLGNRAMLCLWRNGQLDTAYREPSRIMELEDRLKDWLKN
jgi:hypothetical protein